MIFWSFISVLMFIQLFIVFAAVMKFREAKEEGTLYGWPLWVCYVILGLGWILDFFVNIVATLVFLELPHELTVSGRVKRLVKTSPRWWNRWARFVAVFFEQRFLAPLDKSGGHGVVVK